MATQTAIQVQMDELGKQFYLEPFTYRHEMTIPSAYGTVTSNMLIGADADFFVTGISATITDKRGVVQLDDQYRDEFMISMQNLNTGKNYSNIGVEIGELVESASSVEFRGYVWKIQSQIQFMAQHTNHVQFKRPDISDVTANSDIEFHYGRVKVTTGYQSICANSLVMSELWTPDGASVLTGQTQPYISNQSPYFSVKLALSFNGVKLFNR
jgi:hypothetical protein